MSASTRHADSISDRSRIDRKVLDWIAEPVWNQDDGRFDRLAREVFAFQFANCAAYGRFCGGRGITPASIESWRQIPAVPTGAFKELALRCFAAAQTVRTFRTSGTTGQSRGELHLDTLVVYEASLLASLRILLFPDRHEHGRLTLRILAPSAEEAPDSSLSHMFSTLIPALGTDASGFDVRNGELDFAGLVAVLAAAEQRGEPIALCGTAFAFVHFMDALDADGRRFALARGSRIMETGGFKGRSRELTRQDLHARLADRLGIPERRIVNQYGMTELGSQFYDSVLVDPDGPRRKLGPPWAQVRIVDPETGADARPGKVGGVVVHDLANTGSIAAIQTADLGRLVVDESGRSIGFEIVGRDPDAEARGCSIAADEMLSTDRS
jgi:hypothetical protein